MPRLREMSTSAMPIFTQLIANLARKRARLFRTWRMAGSAVGVGADSGVRSVPWKRVSPDYLKISTVPSGALAMTLSGEVTIGWSASEPP